MRRPANRTLRSADDYDRAPTLTELTTLVAGSVLVVTLANLVHHGGSKEALYPLGYRGPGSVVAVCAMSVFSVLTLVGVFPAGWFALGGTTFATAVNVHAIVHRHAVRRAVGQRTA